MRWKQSTENGKVEKSKEKKKEPESDFGSFFGKNVNF